MGAALADTKRWTYEARSSAGNKHALGKFGANKGDGYDSDALW
jgi:hypothetical protein